MICCQQLGCWGVLPDLTQTILEKERKSKEKKIKKGLLFLGTLIALIWTQPLFYCTLLYGEHFIYRVWFQPEALWPMQLVAYARCWWLLWCFVMVGQVSLGQWPKSFVTQQLFLEANSFLSKSYSSQPSWKSVVNFLRPGLSEAI